MSYTNNDRIRQARKARISVRAPFAVQRSNWIFTEAASPPICCIHNETALWQKNRARTSGGQWVCPTCSRLKSKGLRRFWKTEHSDPFTYNLKRSFTMAKHHSLKNGRSFSITFDYILGLWESQKGLCAISGIPMEHIPGNRVRCRNKVTMDRKDCKKGYEPGNVWLVCDWANRAKTDLTANELKLFANGILKGLSLAS